MKPAPIKRDPSLLLFSRDHHHMLLMGWKVRMGLKYEVEIKRIKKYADWFWEENLKQHFEQEEKFIFPVLGSDDSLFKQAMSEHEELRELFNSSEVSSSSLDKIQRLLTDHVRFEERSLFNKVQEMASEEQLRMMTLQHKHTFLDNWPDEFWVK